MLTVKGYFQQETCYIQVLSDSALYDFISLND